MESQKKNIIILISILASLIVLPIILVTIINTFKDHEAALAKEYDMPEDHIYEVLSYDELKKMLNTDTSFALVYSSPT